MSDDKVSIAVDLVLPRLNGRLEKDGAPWYCKGDSIEIQKACELQPFEMISVWRHASMKLGCEVERRNSRWVEIDELVRRAKAGGEGLTKELLEKFYADYPKCPKTGSLLAATKRRLGIGIGIGIGKKRPNDAGLVHPAADALGKDLGPMLIQYERLLKRKDELEIELSVVTRQLSVYKPVAGALDGLKAALRRVKDAAEEEGA